MSMIKNIINNETLNGVNIIGAPLLNSTETNMEVNDGRQVNVLERKILQINSLLGRINLESRSTLTQENNFVCHLNFSINSIPFFSIFGRHEAITGIIKCHGHSDECYEYCLGLTALLTYISSTYENGQKYLIRLDDQSFFDAIQHSVENPTKVDSIFRFAPSRRRCITTCIQIIRAMGASGLEFQMNTSSLTYQLDEACNIYYCTVPHQKINTIYYQKFSYNNA